MIVEHTVTMDQFDSNRGRVDHSRLGRPNPADTEPHPAVSADDIEATRAELRRRTAQGAGGVGYAAGRNDLCKSLQPAVSL